VPIESHSKTDIALRQLETALRLFDEGQDYYSDVTLAGAADEILGRLLESRGAVSALVSLTKPGDEKTFIERANLARNALKHLNVGGADRVSLDIREEAADMLDRAIANYWACTQSITPAMELFERTPRVS